MLLANINTCMKKFISNSLGLKVETPDGYKEFAGVALMGEFPVVRVEFGRKKFLECTSHHKIFTVDAGLVTISELKIGQWVLTSNGKTRVKSITETDSVEPVYDLIEVDGGHRYYTNSILSSNCKFVTDDETLINPLSLYQLKPSEPLFYVEQSRWYREPEANKTYLVALDPSLGTERDYAAIQVFQMPEMIQIAEWQSNNMASRMQVRALMMILDVLDSSLRDNPLQVGNPEIFWTFENNTIGEGILTIIEDTNEERFRGQLVTEPRRKGIQMKRVRRGLHTNHRNRLSACARLKSLVESGRMTINSNNLLRELKNFVALGNKFQAKPGEHDDLVLAVLMVVRMLDIVIRWGTDAGDLREVIGDDEFVEEEPMPVL